MRALSATLASLALAVGVAAQAAPTKIPPLYKNCTELNKRYPHGVGRANARDHVTSGVPVTTFKHGTKLYNLAISYNKGLDRDHDGIACELN